MARLQRRPLSEPTEVRPFPRGKVEIFDLDEIVIGRMTMEPGWEWARDVRPLAGTDRCMYHHLGVAVSGVLRVEMPDGTVMDIGANEAYEMPPGHLAKVIGDEAWVGIDFRGVRSYARPITSIGDRVVETILFTDIVDSTGTLHRIGDSAWRDLLARHNDVMREQLDRYRGRDIATTGDGFLALFDGAARAVECAAAMVRAVGDLNLAIRAGIHTGEVEPVPGGVRGLAVHAANRVMAAAAPGEVLVTATTAELAAGAGLTFESRGRHELKGIPGERELFAVVR